MRGELDAERLLTLWERALGQPAWARGDALLSVAWPGAAAAATLGQRNSRLVDLHDRLFGSRMDLLSHCPACDAVAEFSADCGELAARISTPVPASPHTLDDQGYLVEFRLPDGADIAAASGADDFPRALLDRCVLSCTCRGASVPVRELPPVVLDGLSQRIEALDPGASVSFALACPACGTQWDAALDVGQFVWQKVQAVAERLLLDIDALARRYGWTEAEVLRLSPTRRSAYLQLVTT